MISEQTRSELKARLSFVESQREVLCHELDVLREHIEILGQEERHLKGLNDAWSKN
jgi:hypothetical protein